MGNVATTIQDNPYLVAGIALAAFTGGASLAATGAGAGVAAGGTAAATAAGGAAVTAGTVGTAFSWTQAFATVAAGAQMQAQAHMEEAAKVTADLQQREEEFAAKDREIDRLKRLTSSVSRQIVTAGMSGIDPFTGSPGVAISESLKEGEKEKVRLQAGSEQRKAQINVGRREATRKARINQVTSLADYGYREARRG